MMNITLTLNSDDLRRLEKLVIKDTDTADKHALEGILWEILYPVSSCRFSSPTFGGARNSLGGVPREVNAACDFPMSLKEVDALAATPDEDIR